MKKPVPTPLAPAYETSTMRTALLYLSIASATHSTPEAEGVCIGAAGIAGSGAEAGAGAGTGVGTGIGVEMGAAALGGTESTGASLAAGFFAALFGAAVRPFAEGMQGFGCTAATPSAR